MAAEQQKEQKEQLYKYAGCTFDIISAIVSLLDLSTDIVIIVGWYSQNRMVFFWISVSILICAQLSYIAVFYFDHGRFDNLYRSFTSLLFTIPLSPILSFIYYLVAEDGSITRDFIDKHLKCYYFTWHSPHVDTEASPEMQYLNAKLYKNVGFILEALVEAFPQSILQLTSIVYYNEPNAISIISILISMISVCSKLLLLSASGVRSRQWKLKIFLWLCFVVDFCGAFFIVSFAFYAPEIPEYQQYFITIGNICIYEFLISVVPFAVVGSIGLHIFWSIKLIKKNVSMCCCWFLGISILWAVGLFMTFLIMSIFTTIWAGIGIVSMGITRRLPYDSKPKKFYDDQCEWILSTKSRQDKLLRMAVLNKCILDHQDKGKIISE